MEDSGLPRPARRGIRPWRGLVLLALLTVGFFFVRGILFRQMLYPAPGFPVPASPPLGLRQVELSLGEGPTVHGWAHLEPRARLAVVILHGNGENLGTLAYSGLFESFRDLGVSFLAVDYPGYGRSSGRPGEAVNIAAALAASDWLTERQPQARRVLWGWSLGSGVAFQAARRMPDGLAGLAVFSPWTSLEAIAREHFPGWLVGLALLERYDSLAATEEIRCPVLVVHGREDRIIAPRHGAAISARLGPDHRWVEIPGAGHNDLLAQPQVWAELGDFLEWIGGPPPPGVGERVQ